MTWLMLGATSALASPLLPEDPSKAAFDAGAKAYQSGQFAEAVQAFTETIEADPQLASAYSNRCLAELQQELEEQAIADCTRSLELNPADPNDHLNRGLAYYRLMQPQAALADFNQVLELTPDDYRAYYNRGLTRFDLADYEGAISDYGQSLTHSPDLPNARMADIYNNRAVAYLALNRPQPDLADLNQTLELNQADNQSLFQPGLLPPPDGRLGCFSRRLRLGASCKSRLSAGLFQSGHTAPADGPYPGRHYRSKSGSPPVSQPGLGYPLSAGSQAAEAPARASLSLGLAVPLTGIVKSLLS